MQLFICKASTLSSLTTEQFKISAPGVGACIFYSHWFDNDFLTDAVNRIIQCRVDNIKPPTQREPQNYIHTITYFVVVDFCSSPLFTCTRHRPVTITHYCWHISWPVCDTFGIVTVHRIKTFFLQNVLMVQFSLPLLLYY